VVLRVAHIRGGNFVTRRTHAVSNLELYYENPLVPILHCSFTLLMAAAPRGISSFTSFPSFLHLVPSVPHLDQLCGWWCTWGFRFTTMARTLRYERFYLGNPKGIGEINATRSCWMPALQAGTSAELVIEISDSSQFFPCL